MSYYTGDSQVNNMQRRDAMLPDEYAEPMSGGRRYMHQQSPDLQGSEYMRGSIHVDPSTIPMNQKPMRTTFLSQDKSLYQSGPNNEMMNEDETDDIRIIS